MSASSKRATADRSRPVRGLRADVVRAGPEVGGWRPNTIRVSRKKPHGRFKRPLSAKLANVLLQYVHLAGVVFRDEAAALENRIFEVPKTGTKVPETALPSACG